MITSQAVNLNYGRSHSVSEVIERYSGVSFTIISDLRCSEINWKVISRVNYKN